MKVLVHPWPARLLVPALALLLLCLLFGASGPMRQAQAEGSPPMQAPESAASAQSGVAAATTPTPCPYEGKTDPPPGEYARLIGDDEILLSYRWGASPRGLRNLILNDVNGSLQASTSETNQSMLDEVGWMANTASDLNGDRHAEVFTAFKDSYSHLGAMSYPIGAYTADGDNVYWYNDASRTSGGSLADIDVAAGNLDATDDREEAVVAFRDGAQDLHLQVLKGSSTTGYITTPDKLPDPYDVNSLGMLWDSDERGDMHHTAVATGDLNKDGADEIVTAFKDSGSDLRVMAVKYKSPSTFTVLHNYDSYSATPKFDTVADTDDNFANKRPIDVAVGDLDYDLQDEIVTAFRYGNGNTGELQLLVEDVKSINADGTLVMNPYVTKKIDLQGTHYYYAANDISVSVADLDGDGYDEIALGYTLLYWDNTYTHNKWQHFLRTYKYYPLDSPEWNLNCGMGRPDYNNGLSCLVARPGSWNSSSKEIPDGRNELDPQTIVSVATGDLDKDGMAEIALAHMDFGNNDYLQVVTFDADAGLSKRGSYTVNSANWELAVAMGDYDGDSVWGQYSGHCYYKDEVQVQSVIHAPPFWPAGYGLPGCDNASYSKAGAAKSATDTQGTGQTVVNTVGGSSTVAVDVKGIGGGFGREWARSISKTTTQTTTDVQGTGTLTAPPYFEGVQIGLSHNWCYDYTNATLGTVPVCAPDGTYANDGKDIQWWYRNGPATYGETWVPVGMNLAPGRAASQSSSYGSETPPGTAVAAWAIDGNTDGTFKNGSVSQTLNDLHAWWQLDLGGLQWIDAAQLWNRTDCCSDRLKDFYVLITDKAQWPTACTVGGVSGASSCDCNDPACMKDQSGIWDAYIAGPVGESLLVPVNSYGRLLRVQLAGQYFLQLAEVQIYGMPGTPDQWPKAAPGATVGAGDTFSLAWRNGGPSTVNGRLYYTWPGTTLMSTSAGSMAHPFNLGMSSSAGNVTESGQTEKQTVGFATKIKKLNKTTETSTKHSSASTWGTTVDLNGQSGPLPSNTCQSDAQSSEKYEWAPYVWRQQVTSASGLTQHFLVLDYYVPTATAITPQSAGPADLPVAAPISGPGPQAPLVESPTHPNPDAWYKANTATFTWTQPPGEPEIQSYDWFLGRSPDTIPEGVYRGLTTTKTWEPLDDGTWYLAVRAMSSGQVWGETAHRMIRVDAKPPQVSLAVDPSNPTGNGGWYVTPVSVSVNANDSPGSGVAKVEVSSDGVAWQPYTAALVLSADTPATTVYARATDAVGNVSEPVSTTVKIDRTPPNSQVDGGAGPGAWIAEVVTNPAGNHELALAGAVADNLSGRAGIDLRLDVDWTGSTSFGSWHPFPARPQIEVNWYYTPTLQIGAGYHILTGQAFDVAGNREAEYELGRVLWLPKASPDIAGSSLTASPTTVRPGEAVTFTLVARNAGPQEAHVSIVDTLPEGLTPVLDALGDMSYDPATRAVTWPAGLLWSGQSIQHSFQARADAGLEARSLENQAAFHAFWPNTGLLPEAERKQFEDRERTVVATATVMVNPNLPAGADVTPPWITLAQPYEQVVEGSEISLAIQAAPDATRMYVREWAPDPATGAWIVKRNSGWIKYSSNYTWMLSSGQGVKYVGVWVADGAGNLSTLGEHSLIFVNRMDGSQVLSDGQRVQYRGLLQGVERVSGILATISGDPDLYIWKPRNAFWPDGRFNAAVLPGQVETYSNQFRLEGLYLLEVQAVGATEYELSRTGHGGAAAPASETTPAKALPPHPLTVSDPLSAGQDVTVEMKSYLPLIFRGK